MVERDGIGRGGVEAARADRGSGAGAIDLGHAPLIIGVEDHGRRTDEGAPLLGRGTERSLRRGGPEARFAPAPGRSEWTARGHGSRGGGRREPFAQELGRPPAAAD